MKKFIIFGGGAIGSVFASLLSEKYEVLLIGRKEHVEKINAHGLQLTGDINKKFYIKAATRIKTIEPQTVIFLTVKAHETHDAIASIKDKLKNDTIIICLQNGLGSEDIVKNLVTNKVIRATTFINSIFLKPGKVEVKALAKTVIPVEEKEIEKILIYVNIPTQMTNNIKEEIWKKLIVNCVINGLGSILQVQNNKLHSEYLKETKKEIIKECIEVAKKEGIIIQSSIAETIEKFIQTSTNINSTLQDLLQHKATEIDFLNGAIVQLGNKYKIKTPVNNTIWSLIKAHENLK
jgi:2-dehydropantoate 2-reductase